MCRRKAAFKEMDTSQCSLFVLKAVESLDPKSAEDILISDFCCPGLLQLLQMRVLFIFSDSHLAVRAHCLPFTLEPMLGKTLKYEKMFQKKWIYFHILIKNLSLFPRKFTFNCLNRRKCVTCSKDQAPADLLHFSLNPHTFARSKSE